MITRISRAVETEHQLLEQLTQLADIDGRLPSEDKLCARYDVSRTTIRSALGALAARGLIVRRQGLGNFISRAAHIANPLDQILDFCELIEANGCQAGIQFLNAEIKYPPNEVATALQRPDELVLERRTLFTADGTPVIYCINTIPLWVLPGALAREVVANPASSEPIFVFFEERCRQRIEYRTGRLWPEVAQNLDAPEMACPALTPVQVIDEVGYNVADQPILHSIEYYPGRFMSFDLVRRRGKFSPSDERRK